MTSVSGKVDPGLLPPSPGWGTQSWQLGTKGEMQMHSQWSQLREERGQKSHPRNEVMSRDTTSGVPGAPPRRGEIGCVLCEHHEFSEDWQADAIWRWTWPCRFLSLRTALRRSGLPWVWQWAHHHWKYSSTESKITQQWCWGGGNALGREGVVSRLPSTCATKARLAQWHQWDRWGFKGEQTNILGHIVTVHTSYPCPPFWKNGGHVIVWKDRLHLLSRAAGHRGRLYFLQRCVAYREKRGC